MPASLLPPHSTARDNPYQPPIADLETKAHPADSASGSSLTTVLWVIYLVLSLPAAAFGAVAGGIGLLLAIQREMTKEGLLLCIGLALWLPVWLLSFFQSWRCNSRNRAALPFAVNLIPVGAVFAGVVLAPELSSDGAWVILTLVFLLILLLAGIASVVFGRGNKG